MRLAGVAITVSLFAASVAHAFTITVTGNPGADGAAGVDGGPGEAASAIAADSTYSLSIAVGGEGGSGGAGASGGVGGAASARSRTDGAGLTSALAIAAGGNGGTGNGTGEIAADGGSAVAQARATGADGSDASAIATGGRGGNGSNGAQGASGGDVTLADAVSGRDPSSLVLEQSAIGGHAGSTLLEGSNPLPGGRGGNATSIGDFTNASGGDVSALLVAIGGDAGGSQAGGSTNTGEAGSAHVGGSVTSVGAGGATLEAVARTGEGTTGGALVIDPLLAHASGTGAATASLEAELRVRSQGLSLVNRIDAIASEGAVITLRQTAIAQGASESILDVSKSVALLDLEANARSGDSEGAGASIVVRGRNDAGNVRMAGEALGSDGEPELDRFDARAEFEAQTSGDGHDIEIGSDSRAARAVGGSGDGSFPGIRGGHAEIIATGTALGNSAVQIDVVAEGGEGDDFHGGNATAYAAGSGGGSEAVDVMATAIGGEGYIGIGGDAIAEAVASVQGVASARAVALGGFHRSLQPTGGAALARATGSGASGEVEAVASTRRLYNGRDADDEQLGPVEVRLAATVAGETSVAASSRMADFAAGGDDATLDGFVRSAHTAQASLLDAALSGNPRATAARRPETNEVYALVELELRSGGGLAQTFTADIVLGNFNIVAWDPQPKAVHFSFLDPELDAAILGSLVLRSWDSREPDDIHERVFTDPLDALAFLDDGRLLFGGDPRERHLEIIFETTGAEGRFFLDLVAVAVPEPTLGLLLALAALPAARASRHGYSFGPQYGRASKALSPCGERGRVLWLSHSASESEHAARTGRVPPAVYHRRTLPHTPPRRWDPCPSGDGYLGSRRLCSGPELWECTTAAALVTPDGLSLRWNNSQRRS